MADPSEREFGAHVVALVTASLDHETSIIESLVNSLSEKECRQQVVTLAAIIANFLLVNIPEPYKALQELAIFIEGLDLPGDL